MILKYFQNFICGDWVHMDITGVGKVAHYVAPPYLDPRRMTGRPCRTLTELLSDIATATQAHKTTKKDKITKIASAVNKPCSD